MREIETDYLVIGAGATGIAFVDALVHRADVDVVMVDRRSRPGGHWLDAYPFVRLHQPSATYGVDSRELGSGRIDTSGPNAGYYELATGAEVVEYFGAVLDEGLLPTGRVRFLAESDYVGTETGWSPCPINDNGRDDDHQGAPEHRRRDIRRPVDPLSAHAVVRDRRRRAVRVAEPAGRTVGAELSLHDHRVRQDRDGHVRLADRARHRAGRDPMDQAARTAHAQPRVHATARACRVLHAAPSVDRASRRDGRAADGSRAPPARPTVCSSRSTWTSSRRRSAVGRSAWARSSGSGRWTNVVRSGYVRRIGTDRVMLTGGEIDARPDEVFVDCTARGVPSTTPRPIFEPDRMTLQFVTLGNATYSAATIGVVEALAGDDVDKNALCPPSAFDGTLLGFPSVGAAGHAGHGRAVGGAGDQRMEHGNTDEPNPRSGRPHGRSGHRDRVRDDR